MSLPVFSRKRNVDEDLEAPAPKRRVYTQGDFVGASFASKNRACKDACFRGDLEAAKFFMLQMDCCDPQEPLYAACEAGYVDVVKYLVSAGADVMAQNNWALQTALYHGRTNIVQELVQTFGVKVDSFDHSADGNTFINSPLLRAIQGAGGLDLVKFLVEKGAYNDQALAIACFYKKLDVARYLFSLPNFNAQKVDGNIIESLCVEGAVETIKFLISIGQTYNPARFFVNPTVKLTKLGSNIKPLYSSGQLLRTALKNGNRQLHDCLLQLICD